MVDKGSVATRGVGTVVLSVIVQGKTRKIKLQKVLHDPSMGFKLMSVGRMEERGAEASLKGGKAIIKISDKVAVCGTRKSGPYLLDMAPLSDAAAAASLQLWHERLVHVNVAGRPFHEYPVSKHFFGCESGRTRTHAVYQINPT